MKILLIEDNDKKRRAIVKHLTAKGVADNLIFAKNMTDFTSLLNQDISLFIIDFMLPNFDGGAISNNGKTILESIVKAGKNDSFMLAISAYPEDFPELRQLYESHGCILADFAVKSVWQSALDHLLVQTKKIMKMDFVIFCALHEERSPYAALKNGFQTNRGGIDCYDITIANRTGAVVLLPQMGLVNAAVTAGSCIDRFKPSVIGMSGICGGFPGRAKKGQLLFSSMVYEYQSGKWAEDGFKQEPYQVNTDHSTLLDLKVFSNQANLITALESDFVGTRPPEAFKPDVGIFTSGSAVIADGKLLKQIEKIHRKVNALDMEIFAIQRAAELSLVRPACICAKTVVDLCDKVKNDELHKYGSYISAKFMLLAIEDFFKVV